MRLASLALLLFFSLPAWAWDSSIAIRAPAPVVDELGILQPGEVQQLEAWLRDIKANSGVEIAVYIASSLQGRAIEDFSIAVAEKWQLGRKKEDKGLLFVVAPKERKMRFEVGYGLEGELTDAFTRRVLDNTVRPLFRDGNYYGGITAGIASLQEKIPLGLKEGEGDAQAYKRRPIVPMPIMVFALIFFLLFVFPAFLSIFGLSRRGVLGPSRRGHWGGGGFGGGGGWGGGGSWGGGGGGFGGGGSSSSW
ncbi:MAG: YgcG family protein [Bacteriovoracia bacterium]